MTKVIRYPEFLCQFVIDNWEKIRLWKEGKAVLVVKEHDSEE